jgi:hypothetical protein
MLSPSQKNQSLIEEMLAISRDMKVLIITGKPVSCLSEAGLPQRNIVYLEERFTLHTLCRKIGRLLNGHILPDLPITAFGLQNTGFHSEALTH